MVALVYKVILKTDHIMNPAYERSKPAETIRKNSSPLLRKMPGLLYRGHEAFNVTIPKWKKTEFTITNSSSGISTSSIVSDRMLHQWKSTASVKVAFRDPSFRISTSEVPPQAVRLLMTGNIRRVQCRHVGP